MAMSYQRGALHRRSNAFYESVAGQRPRMRLPAAVIILVVIRRDSGTACVCGGQTENDLVDLHGHLLSTEPSMYRDKAERVHIHDTTSAPRTYHALHEPPAEFECQLRNAS